MSNITVRDLKRILEHANDDDVVVIAARGNGGVGPQSVVPLGSARSGRDWDRGHFILSAPREMSLRLETEEDKRAHRFYAQCVDSWACHQPPLGDGTMKNFSRSLRSHFKEIVENVLLEQRQRFIIVPPENQLPLGGGSIHKEQ